MKKCYSNNSKSQFDGTNTVIVVHSIHLGKEDDNDESVSDYFPKAAAYHLHAKESKERI